MYGETNLLLCESIQTPAPIQDRERSERLRSVLTEMSLRDEKVLFEHSRRLGIGETAGVAIFH